MCYYEFEKYNGFSVCIYLVGRWTAQLTLLAEEKVKTNLYNTDFALWLKKQAIASKHITIKITS